MGTASTKGGAAAGLAERSAGRSAGRSVARSAAWIVGAFVAAAAMSVAALGGAAIIDFPMPSYLPNQAMSTLVVVVAGLALWAAGSRRLPEYARSIAGLLAPAAASAIHQSFLLAGTSHYLNGDGGDQLNRVAYLGRFASSPSLSDAFYNDAAPFYPAGWFWVGGRLADLLGVPAWEFYKPFAIFTMALAGSFAFLAWRALAGSRIAIPLALATSAVGLALAAYEPYSWLFIAVLPALAVWAQRIGRRRYVVFTGVFLGLAAVTYTLIAAIGAVIVTAGAALAFARTPRDKRGTRLRVVRNWVVAGVVSAVIALLFWTPYLLSVLRGDGHERSVATDFAPEAAAHWPVPMLELSGLGLLCMAGLVWLAWTVAGIRGWRGERWGDERFGGAATGAGADVRAPESQVVVALVILVACGYGWFALSGLRAMGGTTLLPFRMTPVITLAFACAGVFALRGLWRLARERAREFDLRESGRVASAGAGATAGETAGTGGSASASASGEALGKDGEVAGGARSAGDAGDSGDAKDKGAAQSGSSLGPRGRQVAALAFAVVALITVNAAQSVPEEDAEFADKARSTPAEPTAVMDAISDVTGGKNAQDLVVLSDDPSLYMYRPYWAFQAPAAAYASPTGEFGKRNEVISGWAEARDGAALAAALRGGEFPGPDALVLTPEQSDGGAGSGSGGEKWVYYEIVNTMPRAGNILRVPVEFDPDLFADSAMFHVEHAGGRVVIGVR